MPLSPVSRSAARPAGGPRKDDKGVGPFEDGLSGCTVPGTYKDPGNVTQ